MPTALTTGRTWTLLSGNYVLKTIASGTAGTTSNAAATGGPSDNNTSSVTLTAAQSGCPAHGHGNTLTFTTPKFTHTITQPVFSVTSSGSCTTGGMSANESHGHDVYCSYREGGTQTDALHYYAHIGNTEYRPYGNSTSYPFVKKTSVAHTHSVPNHTHTLSRTTNVGISDHAASSCTKGGAVSNNTASNATSGHSHTLNSHTHTTGMPANIGVYVWKRTA